MQLSANSQMSEYLDKSGNTNNSKVISSAFHSQYNDRSDDDDIAKLKRILKKPIPARTP